MRRRWRPIRRPSSAPPDVEELLWRFAAEAMAAAERRDVQRGELEELLVDRIRTARVVDERIDDDPDVVRGLIDLSAEASLAELTGDPVRARALREVVDVYARNLRRFY